jgi:uncharacterized protein YeaO (DUF488 family)
VTKKGKREKALQSLSKASIVLVCSAWESYIEDIIRECVIFDVERAKTSIEINKTLTQLVHKKIKDSQDHRTWHSVSGSQWKHFVTKWANDEISELSTPNSYQINKLFDKVLGHKNISLYGEWKNMKSKKAIS